MVTALLLVRQSFVGDGNPMHKTRNQWQADVDNQLTHIIRHQHAILEYCSVIMEVLENKEDPRIIALTERLKAAKDSLNASVSAAVNVASK